MNRIERFRRGQVAELLMRFFMDVTRESVENRSALELDRSVRRFLRRHGMHSALVGYRGYPSHAAVSPNAVAVHGLPDGRAIARGDVFTLDIAARLGGWVSDTAWTYLMPGASNRMREQYRAAWRAFRSLIMSIQSGLTIGEIADVCESSAMREGLRPIPEFVGHGIGRELHEPPAILFTRASSGQVDSRPLHQGMVLNIEPVYTSGSGIVRETGDGWGYRTEDGAVTFHFELTIVVGASDARGSSSVLQFGGRDASTLPESVPFGDFSD